MTDYLAEAARLTEPTPRPSNGALVTVVTATWGRPKTLMTRAIPSVISQTYQPLQHIIVTDGTDDTLTEILHNAGYDERDMMHRLIVLGRTNWGYCDGATGTVPRLVGSLAAAGDYIAYLDDDDEWLPHHVETVAGVLDQGVDLVVSNWATPDGAIQWDARAQWRHVVTSALMHRAELLKTSWWGLDGEGPEGHLCDRWVQAGCSTAVVSLPVPTVIYHGLHHGKPEPEYGAKHGWPTRCPIP